MNHVSVTEINTFVSLILLSETSVSCHIHTLTPSVISFPLLSYSLSIRLWTKYVILIQCEMTDTPSVSQFNNLVFLIKLRQIMPLKCDDILLFCFKIFYVE